MNFAVDIARGMKFLHELPRHQAPRFNLNPRHVVIDEDQRARLNLCDSHFSVLGNHKGRIWVYGSVLGNSTGRLGFTVPF